MKKPAFLFRLLIFICVSVFCYLSLVCFSANCSTINDCLDNALKLKQAGDIDGAILSIRKGILILDTPGLSDKKSADTPSDEDIYTKKYLQILIECLRADEIMYAAIINHVTLVVKKTQGIFFEMADELKAEKLSAKSTSSIKEMKLRMPREVVTHSFCVPPKGYEKVYDLIQTALFWYSKAWGNLYNFAYEKVNEKANPGAEALLSFQKGNEFFSRAGTLMLKIPTR